MKQIYLKQLYDSRELKNDDEIDMFMSVIQEISKEVTVEDVTDLCRVFYDNTNDDDMMFEVVHLIESFRGTRYLEIIASCTPDMTDAHEWARTLNLRILNSDEDYKSYIDVIKSLDAVRQDKILALLSDLKNYNPNRFGEKVDNIFKSVNAIGGN